MNALMNKLQVKHRSQSGFTLIELMVSVAILGVLLAMLAPMLSWAMTFIDAANRNEVTLNNRKLADGLLNYARTSNKGRLPPSAANYAIYNPSASNPRLIEALRNTGVPVSEILGDKAVTQNRRIYQVVRDQVHEEPLYFNTGPRLKLQYDFGVVYMSELKRGGANPTLPGASDQMTPTNYLTWEPEYPDYGAIAFSSLPLQKEMLRITLARLNRLTDKLQSEYHARLRYTAASATTNLFPAPYNPHTPTAGAVGSMGCREGWYDLSVVGGAEILDQLGLNRDEYSTTAWGGKIAYCRDYTTNPASAPNEPPYFAALRIHRTTWATGHPTLPDDAAIISF